MTRIMPKLCANLSNTVTPATFTSTLIAHKSQDFVREALRGRDVIKLLIDAIRKQTFALDVLSTLVKYREIATFHARTLPINVFSS